MQVLNLINRIIESIIKTKNLERIEFVEPTDLFRQSSKFALDYIIIHIEK